MVESRIITYYIALLTHVFFLNLCSIFVTVKLCRGQSINSVTLALKECPAGKVIRIQSAYVGYDSHHWDPNTNPPTCSWQTAECWRSIEKTVVMTCDSQRTCNFEQTIFTYPQGSLNRWCHNRTSGYGNIVTIMYNCISIIRK